MTIKDWIDIAAGIASVATALVAVIAYGSYRVGIYRRRCKLLAKLKAVAEKHPDPQKPDLQEVTILSLMIELSMTAAQVLEAAFGNKQVYVTARGGGGDSIETSIRLRYTGPGSN
jgi:hypothetical protein